MSWHVVVRSRKEQSATLKDLLEALRAIDHLASMHQRGAIGQAQKIARAAIAKAEGK